MFGTYYINDCEVAQVEANSIINIRFGSTCFGFGTKKQMGLRKKRSRINPFPIKLEFNRPPTQCNIRVMFNIGCKWFSVSYKTKGETKPGEFWHDTTGLKIKLFGKDVARY